MKNPKVLFIVPYPSEGASNRLRVEQYLPYLAKEGIQYKVRPFAGKAFYRILYLRGHRPAKIFYFLVSILNRFLDILRAARYDVIFIHREALPIGSTVIETAFSILGKKIIFDFDDAIFLPNTSRSNNFIERFRNPNKAARIIRLSTRVIAGNLYLAEYARKFNNNVVVIPTTIDTDAYTVNAVKKTSGPITIGWIGSLTTGIYLEEVRGVLKGLLSRYPNLKLKFVGNWTELTDPIEGAEYKEWRLEDEEADIRSFDIGVMPMPDDMWTKGKCGFKIILYMACGIPVVSSPVGTNKEIIANNENGFLAESPAGWASILSRLIDDEGLRRRIGLNGRNTALEKYSVKAYSSYFIETLKQG